MWSAGRRSSTTELYRLTVDTDPGVNVVLRCLRLMAWRAHLVFIWLNRPCSGGMGLLPRPWLWLRHEANSLTIVKPLEQEIFWRLLMLVYFCISVSLFALMSVTICSCRNSHGLVAKAVAFRPADQFNQFISTLHIIGCEERHFTWIVSMLQKSYIFAHGYQSIACLDLCTSMGIVNTCHWFAYWCIFFQIVAAEFQLIFAKSSWEIILWLLSYYFHIGFNSTLHTCDW